MVANIRKFYEMNTNTVIKNLRRKRILREHVLRLDLIKEEVSGNKKLDLGCGFGELLDKNTIGIDIAKSRLKLIKKMRKRKLVQADVSCLPFKDSSFNLVICSEILEHLVDYDKSLDEVYRVLKKRGKLIVVVPNNWGICKKIGHLHNFTREKILLIIKNHNFKILKVKNIVNKILSKIGIFNKMLHKMLNFTPKWILVLCEKDSL
jgi:ubiquinone/menaquinone biosynthesis C-methylase UbiE